MTLTHLDAAGHAAMVDVGAKPPTERIAVATGLIRMQPATLAAISAGRLPKGDVLAAARIAGIQAAKQTAFLIPLCHPLPITQVVVDAQAEAEAEAEAAVESGSAPDRIGSAAGAASNSDRVGSIAEAGSHPNRAGLAAVRVTATVKTHAQTGVEMEALTAVSVALLTIYDMAKAVDRAMVISEVRLESKRGGIHGDWARATSNP